MPLGRPGVSSGSDEGDYIVSEVKNHQNLASGVTHDNGTCSEMPAQNSILLSPDSPILLSPGEQGGRPKLGLADFVEIIRKNGVQEELVSDERAELVFSKHASMSAAGTLNFLSLPALVHELLRGQSQAIGKGGRDGKGQEAGGSSCASEVSARLSQGSRRNFSSTYDSSTYDPPTYDPFELQYGEVSSGDINMQKELLREHVLRGLQETAGKTQAKER